MNYPESTAPKEISSDTLPAMSHSRKSDQLGSASPTSEWPKLAIDTESMDQVTSRNDYPQQRSLLYTDAHDTDSAPYVSSYEEYNFSSSNPTLPGTVAYDIAGRHHDTTTPTGSTTRPRPQTQEHSRQARSRPDRPHRTVPANQSPSLLGRVGAFFTSSAGLPSTNSDLEQTLNAREEEIGRLRAELRKKDNSNKQISKDYERKADSQERKYQTLLGDEKRKLEFNVEEFERYKEKSQRERDETIRSLQAEIHGLKSDRDLIQAKHMTFVRQQQEEAFKQMESARWLPPEESKVLGSLERIKRDLKSWAKGTAIKDMSLIQELSGKDAADLTNGLSTVVLLQENQLPQGLSTTRAPALLLNALLAHDVYTNLFCNPFFFLKDGLGDNLPGTGIEPMLHRIYFTAQASNQREAHLWRSQTLRLLFPPLRNNSREEERAIRSWTEEQIAKVSNRHASDFLASPARCLIDNEAIANTTQKLKTIYEEAANISYMLWTRRTTMKCVTLREMSRPIFNVENPNFVPHPLVHPENHKDQLKGRPIAVIVHPLLQVYGTDEAKDYDEGRVWVPAEVWLDSK